MMSDRKPCEGPKHWKAKNHAPATMMVRGKRAGPLPMCFECYLIVSSIENARGDRIVGRTMWEGHK